MTIEKKISASYALTATDKLKPMGPKMALHMSIVNAGGGSPEIKKFVTHVKVE